MAGRDGLAAYVINLPRSVERRERMQAQLEAIGLPYQLFPGVDAKAEWDRLVPTLDAEAFRRNVGREVLRGEIGCYHAHLGAWREFLAGRDDVALMMEDDVVFHPEFLEALDAGLSVVRDWDMLKLNKIRAKQPVSQGTVGQWQVNAYVGPATGLGAYLITRETVARLLPQMLPITRPIDHELDRIFIHDFRHFGLEPFPSHVDDGNQSTITGQGFGGVKKFPWYRRLPMYGLRWRNLFRKALYLAARGRLFSRQSPLQPDGSVPPFSTQ
ncbi:MAG: hypothetical protein DI533_04360 [Cereibacter sphaeroides]|uniref:Glycosyl transferase family 25 domain-containing protein n=1 Tax=Cereibacter sphaeroides TaxID=1063 RepID=A0A2W5SGM6_CERSP|nr:MAG: hypothetical protein DI533_04360 [Cereibacter sphaeroides]